MLFLGGMGSTLGGGYCPLFCFFTVLPEVLREFWPEYRVLMFWYFGWYNDGLETLEVLFRVNANRFLQREKGQ